MSSAEKLFFHPLISLLSHLSVPMTRTSFAFTLLIKISCKKIFFLFFLFIFQFFVSFPFDAKFFCLSFFSLLHACWLCVGEFFLCFLIIIFFFCEKAKKYLSWEMKIEWGEGFSKLMEMKLRSWWINWWLKYFWMLCGSFSWILKRNFAFF